MKKSELLRKAKKLGLEVPKKATNKDIEALITKSLVKTYRPVATKEVTIKKMGEYLKKFKQINATVSYKEKAGVSWLAFQDINNTGRKFDLTEWDAEKVKAFFVDN